MDKVFVEGIKSELKIKPVGLYAILPDEPILIWFPKLTGLKNVHISYSVFFKYQQKKNNRNKPKSTEINRKSTENEPKYHHLLTVQQTRQLLTSLKRYAKNSSSNFCIWVFLVLVVYFWLCFLMNSSQNGKLSFLIMVNIKDTEALCLTNWAALLQTLTIISNL